MSDDRAERELREREIVLRTRQDYESYEADLQQQRSAIVDQNTDGAVIDEALQRIDRLYERHVLDTRSSIVVHEDQEAFLHVSDLVLARSKNRVLNEPGAVSVDSFLSALREQSAARGSGDELLEQLGEMLVRGAGTAVLPTSMPELAAAQRRRGRSGPVERAPSEMLAVQPTDETLDSGNSDDRDQQLVMQQIIQVLEADERANDFEPMLVYELCLQPSSFAETMENLFLVSVLVSQGKLWLAPNKRGLPVVGTVVNRAAYLQAHGQAPEPANASTHSERQQYNFNMNFRLWLKLRQLYTDEPLLKRRRPRDAYDLHGHKLDGPTPSQSS